MKKKLALILLSVLMILPATGHYAEETASTMPAGFVRVTTATEIGWLPLPTAEEGEYTYPLIQILPDGTQTENMIHLLPDGVYMEASTCSNQDCVHEGTVTLENRSERVLGNAILCLPNQVSLELFSMQEIYTMMGVESVGGETT